MKKILIALNSIALVLSLFWYKSTNYEYEPLIVAITLLVALIAQIFISNKSKSLKIKGKKNFTYQKELDSSAEIEGDENITFQ